MLIFIGLFRPFQSEYPGLWRSHGFIFSYSVVIIEFFLSLCLISAFRLLMPYLFNLWFAEKKSRINVLVIGAGQLGALISKVIQNDSNSKYAIAAILDDNKDVHLKQLNGIPVYRPEFISKIVEKFKIQKAIVAINNISLQRKNEFVEMCLDHDLEVLQVPVNTAIMEKGGFDENQMKPINIEDLLNRPSIILGKEAIKNQIQQKTVLVTGGAGSIGSELARLISTFKPKDLVILDQSESPLVNLDLEIREEFNFTDLHSVIGDVCDKSRMEGVFAEFKPDIVFHAAAYKHVPIMERTPREAVNVNISGTKNIADLAHRYGVQKFVMVSTDKAVNPTNVMGASKRIAEMYVQSLNDHKGTQYITTRFGNVLGSNGSVVPRFRKQIEQGGPVTVTHKDITRYFMTIPEASQLVLEAATMGKGGEIFLFDMGEPVRIYDMAEKIIKLSGFDPHKDIEIKVTGLRPGEKLIEELLTTTENSQPTHHPKITIASNQEFDYDEVRDGVEDLIELLDNYPDEIIVAAMKKMVPEYISNNSQFSAIDKLNKQISSID